MTLVYADPSAIARAYFPDEPDHHALRSMLLESEEMVVTSELTRVELARAVRAAARAGRVMRWQELLGQIEAGFGGDGLLRLIAFRRELVVDAAHALVLAHRLGTLDAIHLAVALRECPPLADGENIVFVTRDEEQAAAAAALGLTVG